MSKHAPAGTPCYCGLTGWMPGVEHIPIEWGLPTSIANHQGEMDPAAVVDHIMQGYLSTMVDWARTGGSKVVVHFGIARDGRTVQFHRADTRGIHASAFDHRSPYVAKRVKQRSTSPNNYTVGIEHEGCSVDPMYGGKPMPADMVYGPDNPWPEAMVQASIRVHRWLFDTYPSLGKPSADSIIGHYETGDPTRVNDPAAERARDVWPRERIIRALNPTLTAEQRERLEYLDSPAGAAVKQPLRGDLLEAVGLPRNAKLADYDTQPTPPAAPSTYTVRSGDSLGAIASRFGLRVTDLAAWNGITNPDRIEVGQVLRLTPPPVTPPQPPPVTPPPGSTSGAKKQAALAAIEQAQSALAEARARLLEV